MLLRRKRGKRIIYPITSAPSRPCKVVHCAQAGLLEGVASRLQGSDMSVFLILPAGIHGTLGKIVGAL